MPVGPRGRGKRAQSPGRSLAGNVAFGAGLLFVLTAMTLGGYEGIALGVDLADRSFVSSEVPDDGRNALLVGGLGGGGLIGFWFR